MSEPIRAVYDCMILLQAASRPDRVHGTMRRFDRHWITSAAFLSGGNTG